MTNPEGSSLVQRVNERISEEHEQIRRVVHRFEACTDVATLLACATELRGMLVEHFVLEEEPGGFFETAYTQAPRHHAKLDVLRAEHQAMLADLDALIARAHASLEMSVAVVADAQALCHRLSVHEAAEGHVLIDMVDTDLGEAG